MIPVIPQATYRLQLTKNFGFDEAARVVPYLKALGISHLYASPFLKARAGSTHGYDVTDYSALNPEFGGEQGFARLSASLDEASIGLILDFVPNHMAVGSDNAWWLDVLEWGPRSTRAAAFDVNWDLLPFRRGGGVLLPVLGRPYGEALRQGEIELKYDAQEGSFSACYFQHRFPINPQRYSDVIKTATMAANAGGEPAGRELLTLAADYSLPGVPSYAQQSELKRRLAAIKGGAEIIERGLSAYKPDHEAGLNALHRLLERQHYRLANWRLAVSGINYRRFFDINDLAGLRVEDPRTFRDMHALVGRLIAAGQLHGLRLDHIDGLLDPQQYTQRLQRLVREVRGSRRPFYAIVEKILADGEEMPDLPGVAGTTGYEWLNTISRVLLNPAGREKMNALWREIDPYRANFGRVLERAKLRILETIMASEFEVLVQLISRLAAGHFSTRDFAADRLREALRVYALEFPIYRTYVTASQTSERDRVVIDRTIAAARRRWLGTDVQILDFLRDVLTLDLVRNGLPYSKPRVRQFALKMQQFTGPMTAKSLEDTAFYRYQALLALNEVGGQPTLPPLSVDQFHERLLRRSTNYSHGLTATATHDTKRGEDARMRILALSECADEWAEHVAQWRNWNAPYVTGANSARNPSAGHEYMLYQALVGAWPRAPADTNFTQRIEAYAIKAAREGKVETNWLNPNEEYEKGLRAFVHAILDHERSRDFLESFEAFAGRIALLGALNSLTQLALKATMPGIPDFYQGTEFWDLSLVDPDNRQPVDFHDRASILASLKDIRWKELTEHWRDGRIKLALMQWLLALRNKLPAAFRDGAYRAVEITGPDRDHLIAFERSAGRDRVIVAVGRHFAEVTDAGRHWPRITWDAALKIEGKSGKLHNALRGMTCNTLSIAELFDVLPVAVLRGPR
jgi:(1->4)-alpha-D-glucan 1-alpha-D-glucosylmutase